VRRLDNSRKAEIVAACGSSGSGKTSWLKQKIKTRKRVLVWDAKAEYDVKDKFITVYSQSDLLEILQANKSGALRVSYQPRMVNVKAFDWWARAAYAWGNCAAVAEETADVTTPSKAPDGWGQLIRKGRGYAISVFAVTQRPAESDKTVIGNATLIHCGRLSRSQDRVYMAKEINSNPDDLLMDDLEYIDYIPAKNTSKKGKVRF